MTNQPEKQYLSVEFRSLESDGNRVEGTAAVFGKYARPEFAKLAGHLETIERRAFDKSLNAKKDIRLLWDHKPDQLLARTSSGTLELRSSDEGLHVSATLPNTSYANDLRELMKRGDVAGMSFGFYNSSTKDKWTKVKGVSLRTLTDIDIFEVSIVSQPVYLESTAKLRALDECEFQPVELDVATQLILVRHEINLGGK